MTRYNTAYGRTCLIAFFILSSYWTSWAVANDPNSLEGLDLLDLSIEELMQIEVVSASRQSQQIQDVAMSVSVITAEDIHYSGLTSIPQILQFACGVDVLQYNRDGYGVGIRGLHGGISDRIKLLVNGRLADNMAYGGPDFMGLSVPVADIDRIEIVRGPSGAVWGANAFTGVINIITKTPDSIPGVHAETTVTEFGDNYNHVRWAGEQGPLSLKTSVSYEDLKTSDHATDGSAQQTSYYPALNNLMGFSQFVTRDFARSLRLDTEGQYRVSASTDLSLGMGYVHQNKGDHETVGYYPMLNSRNETTRSFTKLSHHYEGGSSIHMQWFGTYWNANHPQYAVYKGLQNDIEIQYDWAPWGDHHISVGTSGQWTRITNHTYTSQQYTQTHETLNESMLGIFAMDRLDVTQRLTLETQLRLDTYSETNTDWAGRLTGLYSLDDAHHHRLRLGTAKAFRTPLSALHSTSSNRLPVGGGLYALNLELPTGDLDNEETWSLEAGYNGQWDEHTTFRADIYYQRFEKLIGYIKTIDGSGLFHYTPANIDGADSWGSEFELTVEGKSSKASVWYAYNDFDVDQTEQSIRANPPAQHKVGLTGRLFLDQHWTFNTNYRYTDTTPGNPSVDFPAPSTHRLDLTLTKRIFKGQGEVMAGVSDLLYKNHDPVKDNSSMTAQGLPGRTFFGRLKFTF